jgi:hypothetical protein
MLILSPFDRRKPVRDLKGVEPQDRAFERADDRVNAQRRIAIDDPNDSGVLAEPVELLDHGVGPGTFIGGGWEASP